MDYENPQRSQLDFESTRRVKLYDVRQPNVDLPPLKRPTSSQSKPGPSRTSLPPARALPQQEYDNLRDDYEFEETIAESMPSYSASSQFLDQSAVTVDSYDAPFAYEINGSEPRIAVGRAPVLQQPEVRSRLPRHPGLSDNINNYLYRMKNVLKLPKARRWVHCEFFYSAIDDQLFNAENEFSQCLREYFPNLKTRWLRRSEWRAIRSLIGKPRRCSPAFLEEERHQLELKRTKIRAVCNGSINLRNDFDFQDLPALLPRQLAVGMKIHARIRHPKDGIYAGTVDAILPEGYRIVFERDDLLQPMFIRDTEIMTDKNVELLPLTYFLEQNQAALPAPLKISGTPLLPGGKILNDRTASQRNDLIMATATKQLGTSAAPGKTDEKVGNFPVRLLVILVKYAKLIESKKASIRQIIELNNEAEKVKMMQCEYNINFQNKYAEVVMEIEQLNKHLSNYMRGVHDYHNQLLPQLSEVAVISRPEALRKVSTSQAVQIVKHCRNQLGSRQRTTKANELITGLTSLLLQVRQLGQQKCSAIDLESINDTIEELRAQIAPVNLRAFEDHVEVHIKQIHTMLLQSNIV
ncbi:unnamed protein product, partial [Mesorhabditis spiculigera]